MPPFYAATYCDEYRVASPRHTDCNGCARNRSACRPGRRSVNPCLRGARFLLARMAGAGHRFAPHARACAAHGVCHHFTLQRIAMNTELLRRGTLIAMVVLERALDHALFQDLDGLLQEESSIEQVFHQLVKSLFHFLSSPPFGNLRIPFSSASLQAAFTWA